MKTLTGAIRLSMAALLFVALIATTANANDQYPICDVCTTTATTTMITQDTVQPRPLATSLQRLGQTIKSTTAVRQANRAELAECRSCQRAALQNQRAQAKASYFNARPTKTFSYISVSEVPVQYSVPTIQYSAPIIEYSTPVIQTDPCCVNTTSNSNNIVSDYFSAGYAYSPGGAVSGVTDTLQPVAVEVFEAPTEAVTTDVADGSVPVPEPDPAEEVITATTETAFKPIENLRTSPEVVRQKVTN